MQDQLSLTPLVTLLSEAVMDEIATTHAPALARTLADEVRTLLRVDEQMLFSVRAIAERSDLSESKVYELIRQGHLSARKVGGQLRIHRDDYLRFLDTLPAG